MTGCLMTKVPNSNFFTFPTDLEKKNTSMYYVIVQINPFKYYFEYIQHTLRYVEL